MSFDASPLSDAVRANSQTSFLLTWGTADDRGDPVRQAEPFLMALRQAGGFVRIPAVQAAPHFWFTESLDEPHFSSGSIAPRVLRSLRDQVVARHPGRQGAKADAVATLQS